MKSPGVPCFIYHGLYEKPSELAGVPAPEMRYYLSAAQFEHQLDRLAEHGLRACSVADYLSAPDSPQEKRVILTFDDGHISNYTLARPMLQARGFRATFFIVANWIGQPDRMNRDQLNELVRSGMSVGSHGLTHARLSSISSQELDTELTRSKQLLEQMLGVEVRQLALPGGFSSTPVIERSKRAGYECICTSAPGWSRPGLLMNRLSVTSLTDLDTFSALANRSTSQMLKRQVAYGTIQAVKNVIGVNAYERVWKLFGSAPKARMNA